MTAATTTRPAASEPPFVVTTQNIRFTRMYNTSSLISDSKRPASLIAVLPTPCLGSGCAMTCQSYGAGSTTTVLTASLDGGWSFPISVLPQFLTLQQQPQLQTTTVSCAAVANGYKMAEGAGPLPTLPTRWPLVVRAWEWQSTGFLRGSDLTSINATAVATATCPERVCNTSLQLAAIHRALPDTQSAPPQGPWSMLAAGTGLLVLEGMVGNATLPPFTLQTRVTIDGHAALILDISADGTRVFIEPPTYGVVCPNTTPSTDCGYRTLRLFNADEQFVVGADLSCPPFCPLPLPNSLPFRDVGDVLVPARQHISADELPAPLVPALFLTSSMGLYYTLACTAQGYLDAGSPACFNASDPMFSHCAFGSGASCRPCPAGAMCPGGFRAWPLPGYYTPAEGSGEIEPCLYPASDRCRGWNRSVGAVQCGSHYQQGSVRCGVCAHGFYRWFDGACQPCPPSASALERARPALFFVGAALGVFAAVFGMCLLIVWVVGGTMTGALGRSLQLLSWTWTVLQLLAQMAKTAGAGLPPVVATLFSFLLYLQFQGVTVDAACIEGAFPFRDEVATMILAVASWTGVICLLLRPCLPEFVASSLLATAKTLYMPATTAVVRVLDCATTSVTAAALAAMDGGRPLVSASRDQATVLHSVQLLVINPSYVCYGGAHAPAASVAWVCAVLYVAGFPLGLAAITWLRVHHLPGFASACPVRGMQQPSDANKWSLGLTSPGVRPLFVTLAYHPAYWAVRIAELVVNAGCCFLLLAQGRRSFDPRVNAAQVACACVLLSGFGCVLLWYQPYQTSAQWQQPVHVATLATGVCMALLTAATVAHNSGGPVSSNAVAALAYVALSMAVVLLVVLAGAFIAQVVVSAQKEQKTAAGPAWRPITANPHRNVHNPLLGTSKARVGLVFRLAEVASTTLQEPRGSVMPVPRQLLAKQQSPLGRDAAAVQANPVLVKATQEMQRVSLHLGTGAPPFGVASLSVLRAQAYLRRGHASTRTATLQVQQLSPCLLTATAIKARSRPHVEQRRADGDGYHTSKL